MRPKTERLSVRRNFSWTLYGNVIFAASNWLTIIVLTKITTAETVGMYVYALAAATPVFGFTNLGLRSVQATDSRADFTFGDYLGLRIVGNALALLALAIWAGCVSWEFGSLAVLILMGMSRAADSFSDVFYGRFQQTERMDRVARSMILRAVLGLGAWTIALIVTHDLAIALLSLTMAWCLVLIGYDWKTVCADTEVRLRWDSSKLTELFRLALPMGFVILMQTLYQSIPRYVIEGALGARQLGIFGAIASLMSVGNTVVSALGQSASPRLAILSVGGDKRQFLRVFSKFLMCAIGLGVAGVIIAIVWPQELLVFLFSDEYAAESDVLLLLLVAAALLYVVSCLGVAVTAIREFRIQLWVQCFVVAMLAILSFKLIGSYGLAGAAWALIAGYSIQAVALTCVLAIFLCRTQ